MQVDYRDNNNFYKRIEHMHTHALQNVVFGTAYHNKTKRKVNAVDPSHDMAFEPLVPNWTVEFVKDDEQWAHTWTVM